MALMILLACSSRFIGGGTLRRSRPGQFGQELLEGGCEAGGARAVQMVLILELRHPRPNRRAGAFGRGTQDRERAEQMEVRHGAGR